jgi:MFS family permease
VGLGAAAYSPAKYGILTELLPPEKLVVANGWIEGLTVGSIIIGFVVGGILVSPKVAAFLLAIDVPLIEYDLDNAAEAAIAVVGGLYATAALINLFIPDTGARYAKQATSPVRLFTDFAHCLRVLWSDKLGQISLASTTLVWGVSGNMRVIVFPWAAAALGYSTTQASSLAGVVVIGTAVSAVVASLMMRLDRATNLIPLGIVMGLLMLGLNFITNLYLAIPFLVLLGATVGYLVVPMNALLQHRGHNLMGAGRSIAVQNFNEQACILGLGAFYTALTKFGMSAFGAITIFGLVVAGCMWMIRRWHQSNCIKHRDEVERLLAIARTDQH